MAFAAVLEFKGGTLAQYDQVIDKMGLTREGPTPPDEDGFRATDVWETREAFEAFAREQIGPYSREVGLPAPQQTFFEVYNYFVRG